MSSRLRVSNTSPHRVLPLLVLPALSWAPGCGESSDDTPAPSASTTTTAPITPAQPPVTPTNAADVGNPAATDVPPPATANPTSTPPPAVAPSNNPPTPVPSTSSSNSETSTTTGPTTEPTTDTTPAEPSTDPVDPASSAEPSTEPPQSGDDACAANASFCSGFEDAEMPAGAVFKLNDDPATPWTANFAIDTTQKYSGNSSLRVRTDGVGNYRMLAVPSGGATFWVRFYLRSDKEIGGHEHTALAIAATSDDPNSQGGVEFAEDVGLSFNTSDKVVRPEGYGYVSGGTKAYSLPANEWHCIELSFDGPGRVQQLYVGGEQIINATGYPDAAITFTIFKFGQNTFGHSAASLWYDDLVVAPSRIGCL